MNRVSTHDPRSTIHVFTVGFLYPENSPIFTVFGARLKIYVKYTCNINRINSLMLARGLHYLRAETIGGLEMKKEVKNLETMDAGLQAISIIPLDADCKSEGERKALLELQLMMATCSINHEYARMEFDDTLDTERKEQLLEYMNECRAQYFEAREDLASYDPYALVDFEQDLMQQKRLMLAHYNA